MEGRVRPCRLTLARLVEGELKADAPDAILLLAERAEAHLRGRHLSKREEAGSRNVMGIGDNFD